MQLSVIYGLASARLNEGSNQGGPVLYPTAEIIAAVNEGYRLFCLLTLALEKTSTWNVTAATTFFHMLTVSGFSDWIVPLRIATAAGAKVRPATLEDLVSLDSAWVKSPGAPTRYVVQGADLLGIYGQPAGSGTALSVTYAYCPVALSADADVPLIPAEYHPKLVDYAIYRCREMEGGNEFAKALPLLGTFLDAATHYGNYVRARNVGQGYDNVPFELKAFDRSVLMGGKKK